MENILVFLEQSEGKLPKSALVAISAARALKTGWSGEKLIGLCLGPQAGSAADAALEYGFDEVLYSEDGAFGNYLAYPYTMAIQTAFSETGSSAVVATATTTGKDCMPGVAARVDAAQASDILGVNDDGSLRRPMYAGDVIADVELTTEARVVTVRSTAFDPAQPEGKKGEKRELTVSIDCPFSSEFVSFDTSGGDRPELGDAEVVVSGGRAMKSEENFEKYIAPLADVLGAAIGASRAAVDSGYAPNDWQVGQTGKVVAPNLYIAIGISGAIQHLAGMKDSKVIVAINKDPDAPIYEVADYGLVADLFEAVPELTEAISKAKG